MVSARRLTAAELKTATKIARQPASKWKKTHGTAEIAGVNVDQRMLAQVVSIAGKPRFGKVRYLLANVHPRSAIIKALELRWKTGERAVFPDKYNDEDLLSEDEGEE